MGLGSGCVKVCRDINIRVAVRSLQSDKGEVCVHVRSEGAHIKCPQGDHGEGFVRIQEDSLRGYSGSPVQVHFQVNPGDRLQRFTILAAQ